MVVPVLPALFRLLSFAAGGGFGAAGVAASCFGGDLDLGRPFALAFALDFAFAAGLAGGAT